MASSPAMEPLVDLDARLQMLQEDMVVLRRKQDEDRAMIKRLLEKTRNTLSEFQYQLSGKEFYRTSLSAIDFANPSHRAWGMYCSEQDVALLHHRPIQTRHPG
jgi:hypothetical protein